MEQTFEYLPSQVFIEKIDIKDIGNTIIEARNDDHVYYYLTIQTEYGLTRICEFGPCFDGLQYEIKSFKFEYKKINYAEGKIINRINNFLQSPIYDITEAKEITFEDLEKYCNIHILNFIKGQGGVNE